MGGGRIQLRRPAKATLRELSQSGFLKIKTIFLLLSKKKNYCVQNKIYLYLFFIFIRDEDLI